MTTALTYKNLTIDSSELISVQLDRAYSISGTDTMVLYEITQGGVLKANRFNIQAEIRNNAATRFSNWYDLMQLKPTEQLTVLGKIYGDYFLEKLTYNISDITSDNTILFFRMDLSFVEFINFT